MNGTTFVSPSTAKGLAHHLRLRGIEVTATSEVTTESEAEVTITRKVSVFICEDSREDVGYHYQIARKKEDGTFSLGLSIHSLSALVRGLQKHLAK